MSRSPIELELLLLSGAIPEIKIDQVLIRDATMLRKTLEVLDRIGIESNRNLTLGLAQIRVRLGFGKVIALSHGSHLE
jgi:hypothetical protein